MNIQYGFIIVLTIALCGDAALARGGDAALGGFLGGTAGGLLGGAIANKGSSSDDGEGRRKGKQALRAVDDLEEEMRVGFKGLNRRVESLESSVEDLHQDVAKREPVQNNTDTTLLEGRMSKLEASVEELRGMLKDIKVAINDFDHRANKLEDRMATLDRGPGATAKEVVAIETKKPESVHTPTRAKPSEFIDDVRPEPIHHRPELVSDDYLE